MTDLVLGWERSVQRMTLWTGVSLIEEDGVLRRVSSVPDAGNRFDYTTPCTGALEAVGNRVEVRKEECPLGLKAALDRILPRDGGQDSHWSWTLDAQPIQDPEARLVELRSRISGELPARLEAVVYSASGKNRLEQESAVVLHLAPEVLAALRRDAELGGKLSRMVQDDQVLVAEDDLDEVRTVLAQLGLR